jgi:hypothetical protein
MFVVLLMMLNPTQQLEPSASTARFTNAFERKAQEVI